MGSRDDVLRALRAAAPPVEPLPDLRGLGVKVNDLRDRFAQSMAEVGGRCVRAADAASIVSELQKLPEFTSARKIVSLVPEVRGNVDLGSIADPHELNDVDFCVLPAELAVAENAACWIADHGGANRATCFLAQHLAVIVRAETLVADLHDAYARIQVPRPGFAMFLSGPSKTADIEQALVIGAHGARSCTAVLVG